jgi:steroid delta-isomerase-like uncharacterized protein
MSSNSNATTIHRFYEECINQNRIEVLPELVTENVIFHGPDGRKQTGIAAYRQAIHHTHEMFSSSHITVEDVVSNGDKAAARWTMTATNSGPVMGVAPTNKPVTQNAIVLYRFENGKIAEIWLQFDRLTVLQQVGAKIPGMADPSAVSANSAPQ